LLKQNTPPSQNILGIPWNYVTDMMFFNFTNLEDPTEPLDKMRMLTALHLLYDPGGVLIPFTITGKLALQMCSRYGLSWKAELPMEIREAWAPWYLQIKEINGYNFPRAIMPGPHPEKADKQLHVFADAAKDAYAAVAYIRCDNGHTILVRFVQAKSRVRPVKAAHTIPCMELLAIELALQLIKKIYLTFQIPTYNIYIWTDSRACHDWLRIEARALQVFIKKQSTKSEAIPEA
jgi:hypothetical protein